ncbi:uncharacterized protein [Procambarus clarkii]|uniref:uncharacterized protein isoform X2 n=1 Tax=Procambarus clarkii TaxID=6728 RepID=UPI00374441D5
MLSPPDDTVSLVTPVVVLLRTWWAHAHHSALHLTPAPSHPQNDYQACVGPVDEMASSPPPAQGARRGSSSTPRCYLETQQSWDETGHLNHLLLRRPGGWLSTSTPATFNFTSQTCVATCSSQVKVAYSGQVEVMTTWVSGPARPPTHLHHPPTHLHLVVNTTREKSEGLALVWDGRDQSVLLTSSEGTVTVTSGPQAAHGDARSDGGHNCDHKDGDGGRNCDDRCGRDGNMEGTSSCDEGSSSSSEDGETRGSRWWSLRVQAGRSSPGSLVGEEETVMKVAVDHQWAASTRGSTYTTTISGQGAGGEVTHLLNLTTTHSPHQHHKSWRRELHLVPLHLILETEVTARTEESSQKTEIVAELRNSATGARAKFVSVEVSVVGAEEPACDKEGYKVKSSPGGAMCRPQHHSKEEGDLHDTVMESSSVRGTPGAPEPEKETQTITQELTSDVLNLKSNLSVHATPTGGHIVRIRQAAQTPLCPPLGWSLNQIFNLSRELSGWEYVVSQWGWGNMVVRAEFGASPLQWYQKIFAFSLDQAAPLPSTHLVLDFRDSTKFLVRVRWPTLAAGLTTSLTLLDHRYTLQVTEVDEFRGEGGGEELVWVLGDATREGEVEVTWSLHTQRLTATLADAAALLTQAASHPGACGPDPAHQPSFRHVLERLLGHDPSLLWHQLLRQGSRLLHRVDKVPELHYLWEALEEELGLGESKSSSNDYNEVVQRTPWAYIWAVAEQLGVVKERREGAGVVVYTGRLLEASKLALNFWEEVAGAGVCGGALQGAGLADLLASLLKLSCLHN